MNFIGLGTWKQEDKGTGFGDKVTLLSPSKKLSGVGDAYQEQRRMPGFSSNMSTWPVSDIGTLEGDTLV